MQNNEVTPEKMTDDLREKGIVAYSHFATACLSLAALLVLYLCGLPDLKEFLNPPTDLPELQHIFTDLGYVFLFMACLIAVPILFSVCLQTKFFFSFRLISVDLNRLNPFSSFNPLRPIFSLFRVVLELIILVGISYFIFIVELNIFSSMLAVEPRAAVYIPLALWQSLLPILIVGGVLLAFIAFYLTKRLFLLKHKIWQADN